MALIEAIEKLHTRFLLWNYERKQARIIPIQGKGSTDRISVDSQLQSRALPIDVGGGNISFTRQLAFGWHEEEGGEGRGGGGRRHSFYNSTVSNLAAKIATVAILLVTFLLLLVFYLKNTRLELVFQENHPVSTSISPSSSSLSSSTKHPSNDSLLNPLTSSFNGSIIV